MKNFFRPARIGFYILMLLTFFMVGLFYADWTDAGKNQGLAGGAIVLGYAAMFGGIAFLISFIIASYLEIKIIKKLNWLLLILLAAAWSYKFFEFMERDALRKEKNDESKPPSTTIAPKSEPTSMVFYDMESPTINSVIQKEKSMGMGFFIPNMYDIPTLYFYGDLNLEKSVMEHPPIDSITFGRNKYNQMEITTAPPWLVPEIMKLDYDLLYFKVVSISDEFIEIIVNEQTGRTTFVDRGSGKLQYWPDFLLAVHSVEFLPDSSEKVRSRAFISAEEIITPFEFMHPIKVKQDWMYVELWNSDFKKVGNGCIQWKRNNRLLILFNLLS